MAVSDTPPSEGGVLEPLLNGEELEACCADRRRQPQALPPKNPTKSAKPATNQSSSAPGAGQESDTDGAAGHSQVCDGQAGHEQEGQTGLSGQDKDGHCGQKHAGHSGVRSGSSPESAPASAGRCFPRGDLCAAPNSSTPRCAKNPAALCNRCSRHDISRHNNLRTLEYEPKWIRTIIGV